MILRLTVHDPATGSSQDIEVTAAPRSSVAALLAALPLPVDGRPCFVGAVPLDPRASLADTPLVPGSIISVGEPGPTGRPAGGANAAGVLEVLSGPDVGLAVALGPGRHLIARSSKAPVPLRDRDVSRQAHAELVVHDDGTAEVVDAGSSNGTFVGGVRITAPTRLTPRRLLRLGADELRWTPTPAGRLRAVRAPDGRLDFDRAFAAAPAVPSIEVTFPVQQPPVRGNAPMTLLGAGVAVVAALLLQQPLLWLGAAAAVIGYLVMSSSEDLQSTKRKQAFTAAKKTVEEQISEQVSAEQRVRRLLAPGPTEIAETATGERADLWTRRADSPYGLTLRIGTADQPAAVTARGEPWPGFETPTVRAVPVTVDLRTTGVLGVVGAAEPVDGMLRWLLIQLATLRGPDDLRLFLITAGGADRLDWIRWLPHLDAGAGGPVPCRIGNTPQTRSARVAELRQLVAARRADRGPDAAARTGDEVVVVLDGALALRELPGMDEVLRDGPAVGVYLICADRHGMNECRGLCEVGPRMATLTRGPGEPRVRTQAHTLDEASAEHLARALAPMRDRATLAAAHHAIPDRVRLLDLLGVGVPSANDVLALWGEGRGPRTRVILGADARGPVHVDLAGQGPHTMLGGATGAGKSVLLQTLVTALLLANRPDELNLVLVDFKGGSAFLPFEGCPHVIALIRSTGESAADVFDDAAAARVLASIRAEVSRRESLLARYEGEIDRYWDRRRAGADLPPLPRLVMIFDEFARVLDTAPDFVRELVNVAAKGRSLGMHLVLATQSLQGKLSPELKNNVSLRISLRQNEAADSTEVLGVPDAAAIPGTRRGRGMIFCTTGETRVPQEFQSGYLGEPPPSGASPVTVRTLDRADLGAPRPAAGAPAGDGPTDQELAIAAVRDAAGSAGLSAPFRPLLPALPATLTLADLTRRQTVAPPVTAVPFGLADEPGRQAQPAEFLDLAAADRLLVAGGPQSGRTTFARALITSLVTRFGPDQAHFYVVERHPGGLADYADLPHCGGVFTPADPDRIRRLITWLGQEVRRRGAASPGADGVPSPRIVVVIDGWEHFEDHGNPDFVETALLTTLRGVVSAGAPLGVHVVPLGGEDMLNHKLPRLYNRRLLLPFPKEDTRRAHLSAAMASPSVLPGRAIDAATGCHLQICRPTRSVAQLIEDTQDVAPGVDPARFPLRFPALPVRVTLGELSLPEPPPSATWIPLGVGADDVTVGVDFFETGPHLLLISGPSGAGRSTAAATVSHGLARRGVGVLAIAPPRSPLPRLLPDDPGVRVLTGAAIRDSDLRAAAAAFDGVPFVMVVDDVDHLAVLPTEQGFTSTPTLFEEIAHPAARGERGLVLAGDAAPVLTGFPGPAARLINTVMTTGLRLLLTPENRAVALAHNVALEPDQYFTDRPGRGYLSTGHAPTLLQLAMPASEPT
ncbi:FtsK/SpoIIIE domain-containing protein [Micromonospora sp. DR5-3]|uniref:FtsK/SpoIIIE domain-containing protein n=1 Tax=unclassified Micromonospora TaxID=2617518 RepID=UPI0011D75195|nr:MULTISPECIES: FtsK/SpoIIIE domain-containing protein [unclassified Micromonospora]MCW3815102.1 FtsK/SpoIIIE domain-containing protein [Micromonospora sp. DR5-3]TYC21983.1 FHA domain-containing protein [Micromonospora sp. MP36]